MYDDMCIIVTSAAQKPPPTEGTDMAANIETIAYRYLYGAVETNGLFDKVDSEDDE